ncbi:MAG: Tol-Pal system beta propeller repeat protein TolB [Thermodesulfobacteriota bacterium]
MIRDLKRYLRILAVSSGILLWGLISAVSGFEFIDINNPFLRKIPIAVPYFKAKSNLKSEIAAAQDGPQLLGETLSFIGFFKVLDRGAFLEDPQSMGIETAEVNFKNWIDIGADLLVTGGISIRGESIEMELRLFDTFKGKMLVGKRYDGAAKDQRIMIRQFCDEILYALTGKQGVFGSKIAFVSNQTGNKEIYICDFDGTNPRQFTRNKAITLSPAWSADGNWMAYTSYVKGKPDLFIRHLKENQNTRIEHEGLNITPAWHPRRSELAATLSFSGDQEIYLLTQTGKVIKRLTQSSGIDVSPSWSPDGTRFAFVSKRSGTPQIHIQHMDSNQVERVTFYGKHNTQPAWSPSGDRIAYTSMEKGETNIFTVGTDGKNPVQLTHHARDNESPTWSPDGNLIAFSSNREGKTRIYVMTAFGTDQRRLLTMAGEQTNPQWSPRIVNIY